MTRGSGRGRLEAVALRAALLALGALPGPLAAGAGWSLGQLAWLLLARRRAIALGNLETVFGERLALPQRRRIGRRSLVELGRLVVDFARLPRLDPAWVEQHVEFDGLARLDAAVARGRGVLQVGAHFGCWELLPHAFACIGRPMSFVVRPANNPRVESVVRARREHAGSRVIAKRDALRECLQQLKGGQIVGMLIDQHVPPGQGPRIRFLGQETAGQAAPAALALRTGAVLLPTSIRRIGLDRHCIRIGDEIELARSGGRDQQVADTTARIHDALGTWIEAEPESWLWIHRRFRSGD